MALDKIKYGAL